MKASWVSVGRFWNHLIACDVLLHRLTLVAAITFLLILSRIYFFANDSVLQF